MRGVQLPPIIAPHPCRRCGVIVRIVTMTNGNLATIDETPSPDGYIIPWPNSSPSGLAMGRRIEVPVSDGPMWREHSCR